MPRKPQPWFRFYTEAFNDRKILRLTPTQRWVWVAILGAARESPAPRQLGASSALAQGQLLVSEDLGMTPAELARYADVRTQDVVSALRVMEHLGMITQLKTPSGTIIQVTNWGHRQYESDNVTARTQAFRERSNERSNRQGRNVATNVLRNTPDTETDTEDHYLRP